MFNQGKIRTGLQRLPVALVCLLVLAAGCATQKTHQAELQENATIGAQGRHVQPGDTVSAHFLCRLRSGEVVAATDDLAENQRKSNLYVQHDEKGPLSIAAVSVDAVRVQREAPYEQRSLEEEISVQLALAIVGMKEGETRTAEINAESAPE